MVKYSYSFKCHFPEIFVKRKPLRNDAADIETLLQQFSHSLEKKDPGMWMLARALMNKVSENHSIHKQTGCDQKELNDLTGKLFDECRLLNAMQESNAGEIEQEPVIACIRQIIQQSKKHI